MLFVLVEVCSWPLWQWFPKWSQTLLLLLLLLLLYCFRRVRVLSRWSNRETVQWKKRCRPTIHLRIEPQGLKGFLDAPPEEFLQQLGKLECELFNLSILASFLCFWLVDRTSWNILSIYSKAVVSWQVLASHALQKLCYAHGLPFDKLKRAPKWLKHSGINTPWIKDFNMDSSEVLAETPSPRYAHLE